MSREPRRPIRRLFGYLAPYRGRLALATGASVANKILDLVPPLLVGWVIATIRNADRIIVLRGGRIAEEGHHDDLLARGGTFADLWHVQAGDLASATASP